MEIDVFWSFRSPWSYLATRRLKQWQDRYELIIHFKPVYPLIIRNPDFFLNLPPLQADYFKLDLKRVSEFLQLPFAWPSPDPVSVYMNENGLPQPEANQPYIHELTKLGLIAVRLNKGINFADEVSALIWGGTKDWNKGDHLTQAAARSGLNLRDMKNILKMEEVLLEEIIQLNQLDHNAAGHWGVPTCVYKGEPFFGQDRLDVLLWRLKKDGLKNKL